MRRIEQRSSQRRPYLVGEARHHFSQRRKSSLMIRPLLKRAHFRDVREKRDLPRFVAQRAKGQADRLSTRQASLMGILDDRQGIQDIAPVPTQQRLAEKESATGLCSMTKPQPSITTTPPGRVFNSSCRRLANRSFSARVFSFSLRAAASSSLRRATWFEVEIGSGQIFRKRVEYLEGILQAQDVVESLIGAVFDSV